MTHCAAQYYSRTAAQQYHSHIVEISLQLQPSRSLLLAMAAGNAQPRSACSDLFTTPKGFMVAVEQTFRQDTWSFCSPATSFAVYTSHTCPCTNIPVTVQNGYGVLFPVHCPAKDLSYCRTTQLWSHAHCIFLEKSTLKYSTYRPDDKKLLFQVRLIAARNPVVVLLPTVIWRLV